MIDLDSSNLCSSFNLFFAALQAQEKPRHRLAMMMPGPPFIVKRIFWFVADRGRT
jgi:hypothetical protein